MILLCVLSVRKTWTGDMAPWLKACVVQTRGPER